MTDRLNGRDGSGAVERALLRAEAAERALAAARKDLQASQAELDRVRGSLRYRAGDLIARLFGRSVPSFLKPTVIRVARAIYRRIGRRGAAAARGHDGPAGYGNPLTNATEAPSEANGLVTVVVPVYNAFEHVKHCLDALERRTWGEDVRLLLIDDGSTDERIAPLLQGFVDGRPRVRAILRGENWGYTRTVNQGVDEADPAGDVVLLNSDTEVGPLWLQRLRKWAYAAPDVASVTAVSDNAGAFSAPPPADALDMLGLHGVQRVAAKAELAPVETPTANGFCVYLRRDALDAVGAFDAKAFPKGYGEENDWSMRAGAAGRRHLVAPDVFVRHARSQSFGSAKTELLAAGRRVVDARWPDYAARARAFADGDAMAVLQSSLRRAWAAAAAGAVGHAHRAKPTVLYVHHRAGGGTPQTNADLMGGLLDRCDPLRLVGDGRNYVLERLTTSGFEPLETFRLAAPMASTAVRDADYERHFRRILHRHAVELVHVRHLFRHPIGLLEAAKEAGLPTVFSLHDFFAVCPSTHLVNGEGTYCAGDCGAGGRDCDPMAHWRGAIGRLRGDYVHEWRKLVADHAFAHADAVVTTSPEAARIHADTFGPGAPTPRIIEHGRDIDAHDVAAPPDAEDGPVRVLLLGSLTAHKGGELIRAVKSDPRGRRFEFHLLGRTWPDYAAQLIDHGRYEREALAERAQSIRPSLAAFASIWPETYCHTLTEAWRLGLPAVASKLGALGERVAAHGGGVTFDPRDASSFLDALEQASAPEVWARLAAEARAYRPRSVAEMSDDYWRVYSEIWANCMFSERSSGRPERSDVPSPDITPPDPSRSPVRTLVAKT